MASVGVVLILICIFGGAPLIGLLIGRATFEGGWCTRYVCNQCGHISSFRHVVGGYGTDPCQHCGEHHGYHEVIARPSGFTGWEVKSGGAALDELRKPVDEVRE